MSNDNTNSTNRTTPITPFLSQSPPPPNFSAEFDEDSTIGANNNPSSNNQWVDVFNNNNNNSSNEISSNYSGDLVNVDEANKNNENAPNVVDDDDDDEWADFVDPTTAITNVIPELNVTLQLNNDNSHPSTNDNARTNNIPSEIKNGETTVIGQKNPSPPPFPNNIENSSGAANDDDTSTSSLDFGYLSLIDKLAVVSSDDSFRFGKDLADLNEINVDLDETWMQLKDYTSVNDASSSLKFKWLLSELENNYLNSINVNRVVLNNAQNRIPSYSNLLSNGILQPIKIDSASNSKQTILTDNHNEPDLNSLAEPNAPHHKPKLKPNDVEFLLDSTRQQSLTNSTPVLDFDLSYFETQSTQTTTQQNHHKNSSSTTNSSTTSSSLSASSTSSAASASKSKAQKNSQAYINQLLQDIYISNDNKPPPPSTNLDEALTTSKKSTTSAPSLHKSFSFGELQLQPAKLEKQHYLNLVEANRNSDKQAIEFLAKLTGNTNSKPVVFANNWKNK